MGWVGLGQLFGGLGWAGSIKIDPRTTLIYLRIYFTDSSLITGRKTQAFSLLHRVAKEQMKTAKDVDEEG